MAKDTINIGILGLGTVGGGTIEVLTRNADAISRRSGKTLKVTHASARDINKQRSFSTEGIELLTDPMAVATHTEVDIVCELIGGTDTALDLVLAAIEQGKHVVTANKALIALHGHEIFAAAEAKGVMVAYEAAVAGGIPIIKAMREGLSGNAITSIAGIINGTTNFILTEMREQGRDFDDVLKEAQALGYAEADPTFDIEGIDAAHKLTILASIAFGIPLQFDKMTTEGITKITPEDTEYANELGYRIKHLGIARHTTEGIELRVHPTLIPERRLIANVDGVKNAVLVNGDAVGPTIYYGAGAGAEPTASAVVADIVDVVRALDVSSENQIPYLGFHNDKIEDISVLGMDAVETGYFLRMQVFDKPGVLADITRIFGDAGISIEAIIQKEPQDDADHVPIIFLTQVVKEKNMNNALAQIEKLDAVNNDIVRIRVESLS